MRDLRLLDAFRVSHPGRPWDGDETCGQFVVPSRSTGVRLNVIASSDLGWDHVSVSLPNRCPNWPEMEQIRRMFFRDDECVIQIHAPIAEYIDGAEGGHQYCLHLWRPHNVEIPRPPRYLLVGAIEEVEQAIKATEAEGKVVR